MHTKKNATFLLNVVLSMLILAYITFVTVYEQILTQNNGFFNVIIYGVVLILVFIFMTLFIRILSFNKKNEEKSIILVILKILGIAALFALFIFARLRYTSSISPTEYPLYNTANYICNNQLAQAKDIHAHIINYPADFVYGLLLSKVFGLTGVDTGIFVIINIGMMLTTALFVFLTVNLIAGEACATLALIITLFMPNNGYLVYSYNAELFTAANFFISFFLYEVLIYKRLKKLSTSVIVSILCGIFGGIAISCEPVIILVYIAFTLWVMASNRQTRICSVLPIIISIVESIVLSLIKSIKIGVSFGQVFTGMLKCFNPAFLRDNGSEGFSIEGLFSSLTSRVNNPSKFLEDNSYFLSNDKGGVIVSDQALWLGVLDQFIYLFVIILCVLCVVYIIRVTYDKVLPLFSALIMLFLGQVLGGGNDVSYVYFITTIIIIGSTTAYYMYLNHHPQDAIEITNDEIRKENMLIEEFNTSNEENDSEESSEYMLRARALVFVGENENLYSQIKAEEKANRESGAIAATIIKTAINEEGEYDSIKQDIEFFDEPDKVVEAKPVHEVVAIPATRPVETVKPLLADEYISEGNEVYSNESDLPIINSDTVEEISLASDIKENIEDEEFFDGPDEINNIEKEEKIIEPPVQPEGFVFRKKENGQASSINKPEKKVNSEPVKPDKKAVKNAEKANKNAEKEALRDAKKAEKEAKRAAKKGMAVNKETPEKKKSLDEIKPGEPLPNPLKGPKPSNKSTVDFDFNTSDDDDFDF